MNANAFDQLTVKAIHNSAIDQIARQFECAVSFLTKYAALRSENISVIDDRYADLEFFQNCFYLNLKTANHIAFAFKSAFLGSEFEAEFEIISAWAFTLDGLTSVFQSVDYHKSLISRVSASLRSGTLEMPSSNLKEAA